MLPTLPKTPDTCSVLFRRTKASLGTRERQRLEVGKDFFLCKQQDVLGATGLLTGES